MPTPLAYRGLLYVLANNGVFDAYDIASGKEIYRQRLPLVGSGFSASPVAADGKIYLSNEDGEMLVIEAGEVFKHLATNSMGETLMATPAISEGVMYVRGASTLFAISGRTTQRPPEFEAARAKPSNRISGSDADSAASISSTRPSRATSNR